MITNQDQLKEVVSLIKRLSDYGVIAIIIDDNDFDALLSYGVDMTGVRRSNGTLFGTIGVSSMNISGVKIRKKEFSNLLLGMI